MLYTPMNGMSPIGDAAYDLLEQHRAKFEGYRGAAYGGDDPEAIHQMRVNARRLRVCLRAFAPVLAQPVRELGPELRWIAASLGGVRDVDVFAGAGSPGVLADAAEAIRTLRATRLAQLRADLDSARYANLTEALRCRIAVRVQDDPALAAAPVLIVAADIVGRAYRSVRRASRDIEGADPTAIHSLRKRAKRLRYTADCFASLYGKAGKRFISTLKDVQDLLGAHQDAIVAQSICAELEGHGADAALSRFAEESLDKAAELRGKLPDHLAALGERWADLKERMRDARRRVWAPRP